MPEATITTQDEWLRAMRQLAACGPWSAFHANKCSPSNWVPSDYKGWALFSTRTNPFEARKDGRRLTAHSAAALKQLIDNEAGGKDPASNLFNNLPPDFLEQARIQEQDAVKRQACLAKGGTVKETGMGGKGMPPPWQCVMPEKTTGDTQESRPDPALRWHGMEDHLMSYARPPSEPDVTPTVDQTSPPPQTQPEKKKPNYLLWGGAAAAGVAALLLMK